jgi:hypothetical protein
MLGQVGHDVKSTPGLTHVRAPWLNRQTMGRVCSGITLAVVVAAAQATGAQELEPRAYSPVPIGTNFLLAGFQHTTGRVATDPSLPISNLRAAIGADLLAYSRSFALAGQTASAAALLPYLRGQFSGDVGDESREVSRSGAGDLRLRLAVNLLGGRALTPEEFVRQEPETILGASLTVVAPTGQYEPARLINAGSNRWAIKPEIGLSQPLGNWFADAAAGAWLYTDNTDFFGGNDRSQAPLWNFQVHGGYYFRPGLWLAADATYYTGGSTSLNGVDKDDAIAVARYGLTLSIPLVDAVSMKFSWSTGLVRHGSGDFDTFGLTLQYRWFDR